MDDGIVRENNKKLMMKDCRVENLKKNRIGPNEERENTRFKRGKR
jgi:hypothetical protein